MASNGLSPARPPFPLATIEALTHCLKNRRAMLRADSRIVFVCGATPTPERPLTARGELLRYARRHFGQFMFFEAEQVFRSLSERGKDEDLLSLEDDLAAFSDCIIIIVESPGAIAELGAFSLKDEIAKTVLAINAPEYRVEGSFITDGPMKRLNRRSRFKPMIHAHFDTVLSAAQEIENRLSRIPHRNRMSIPLASQRDFEECEPKHRLMFLADIISLCSPVKYNELSMLIERVLDAKSLSMRVEISLLRVLKLVDEEGDCLIRRIDMHGLFFDYVGMDFNRERARIVQYLHKRARPRLQSLMNRAEHMSS